MNSSDIDNAIDLITSSGEEFDCTGGVSTSDISDAENFLNTKFPDDYVYFLKHYGSFSFESEEFYGVTKDGVISESVPSVIFTTKVARARGDISNDMIKIKSSGYGPSYCIDLSLAESGNSPVVEVALSFKRDGEKKMVAKSFSEFFLNEIKNALSDL
ncbi:MAG: SMI1/KNR4 family protein [Marinobacter sp.]|nr:SMI1/KNR4 family protein [Marinobacter sp.]